MKRVLILQPPWQEAGVPPGLQATILELLVVAACAGGDVACPAEEQKERQEWRLDGSYGWRGVWMEEGEGLNQGWHAGIWLGTGRLALGMLAEGQATGWGR